jgi:hypothetical protein
MLETQIFGGKLNNAQQVPENGLNARKRSKYEVGSIEPQFDDSHYVGMVTSESISYNAFSISIVLVEGFQNSFFVFTLHALMLAPLLPDALAAAPCSSRKS